MICCAPRRHPNQDLLLESGGTLWRSLASSTSASCNRLRISADFKLLRTLTFTSRSLVTKSTRDSSSGPDEATDQAHSMRHSTDARPYIISGSATMLKFVTPDSRVGVVLSLRSGLVLSLVVCGEVGPSTASLANQAPVYCGCPAGTHGCDLVSRVRLDQSANPVVVWLGLVSRVREVTVETWNMRKSQHPSSTRS